MMRYHALAPVAASLLRKLPVKSGLTRLSFNRFVNPMFLDRTKPLIARLRDGTPIEVDPNEYHGRILYLFGSNDRKVSGNVEAFLKPGDVFLDIGANYSSIGLAASHIVGKAGAVHLFEPQKFIADRVEAAASRYSNVHLHRVGLLDVDGEFTINGNDTHSGKASFVENENSHELSAREICQVKAIASYVGPLVEGRPFGVKIDIEGAEPRVIPWLLAQPNMRFMVFEAAMNSKLLYDEIVASDMTLFGLCRDPLRLRIELVNSLDDLRRFHDAIAVRLAPGSKPPRITDPRTLARSSTYRLPPQGE